MKPVRHKKILEIVRDNEICTQQALADALVAAGYNSTQATISRDIRELGLVKELTADGKYRYIAGLREGSDHSEKLRTIFCESVSSVSTAQNLVVIKTLPGLAPAACSAIDGMDIDGLVGTLAGDDTAFFAMVDKSRAESFCSEIENMII